MTVLQALARCYDRMAACDEVVAPGWSTEPIGTVIELDENGTALAAIAWLDDAGPQGRPPRGGVDRNS